MLDINESEKKILRVLLGWNYNAQRCNSFQISMKTGLSESSVHKYLRKMEYLGWITKRISDRRTTIFIKDGMKPMILEALGVSDNGS